MVSYQMNDRVRGEEGVILRFKDASCQAIGSTAKISGLVEAKYLISLISLLDLQANPRNSKTGQVTDSIQESIEREPDLFPFKTKGILLAASSYEQLQRGRIRVHFNDTSIEGILDGGHNTLAIGLYILRHALAPTGQKVPRRQLKWADFKQLWNDNADSIRQYLLASQGDEDETGNEDSGLSFYVPVELLVPSDPNNPMCVDEFLSNLLEICEARNNNAELTIGAKANQKGYFDALRQMFEDRDPELCKRIEWKTNDKGDIKVQDIIALTWIPLRHVGSVHDKDGKLVEPPSEVKLYSSKASCLKQFERFMSSPEVSLSDLQGTYKADAVCNEQVLEAFKRAVEMPFLYDEIYARFPDLYNAANGKYNAITSVKKLNSTKTVKTTPYTRREVKVANPDGFIMPLVYGMHVLVNPDTLEWLTDPREFLDRYLPAIVRRYYEIFQPLGWDPQKIGKAALSYTTVEGAYKMALAGIL